MWVRRYGMVGLPAYPSRYGSDMAASQAISMKPILAAPLFLLLHLPFSIPRTRMRVHTRSCGLTRHTAVPPPVAVARPGYGSRNLLGVSSGSSSVLPCRGAWARRGSCRAWLTRALTTRTKEESLHRSLPSIHPRGRPDTAKSRPRPCFTWAVSGIGERVAHYYCRH